VWVVESGQASVGTAPDKLNKMLPVLRSEKVSLSGLQPGKTVYYQAFPGESGKGSFKTAPAGTAEFEFVFYGDTRTRHDVHRSVIQGVLKYANPDFIVDTGDLVEDGSDSSLWPIFFDAERELLRKTAFFPAPGNHEHNAREFYDFMNSKPYYSFDLGTSAFLDDRQRCCERRRNGAGARCLLAGANALVGGRLEERPKRGIPVRGSASSSHDGSQAPAGTERPYDRFGTNV
jgi:hypothetical protein